MFQWLILCFSLTRCWWSDGEGFLRAGWIIGYSFEDEHSNELAQAVLLADGLD